MWICGKEDVEEDEEDVEEDEEKGVKIKAKRGLGSPTAEEPCAHRLLHLPYRSWCADSVTAKRKDHHRRALNEREVAAIIQNRQQKKKHVES